MTILDVFFYFDIAVQIDIKKTSILLYLEQIIIELSNISEEGSELWRHIVISKLQLIALFPFVLD
jgi:hypothetical protein